MKLILLCVALLLVVSCVCSAHETDGKHKKHRQNKSKHTEGVDKWLSPEQKARKNDKCKWVCEGDRPGQNGTTYPDGSWSYDLQVGTNEMLHIAYNITSDFLAIFNSKLNITWITDGIYIGIFNMTSDALFLIDTSKDIASIFTGVGNIAFGRQAEIMFYFGSLFEIVLTNSLNMVGNFAFQVDAFLKALAGHTLAAFFHGHIDVFNVFNMQFGIYMNGSIKYDGFNTFLKPVVGVSKFSIEIVDYLTGTIDYGRKLPGLAISGFFSSLTAISVQITLALQTSLNSVVNLGQGTWHTFWNLGGSFLNVITGSFQWSGGGSIHISTGKTNDNSWIVNYGNATGNFSLNYNASRNYIGFYNQRLQTAIVASGNVGMYVLFNVTSGIGMIVHYDGFAYVITDYAQVVMEAFQGTVELQASFSLLADILAENANFDQNSANVFDFKGFLGAFFNHTDVSGFFSGNNSELATVVDSNFGGVFILTQEHNGAELFAKFGIAVVFNGVFGFDAIGENFGALFDIIYSQNEGKFTEKFMQKVYVSVKSNISAGSKGFSSFIFSGIIKACFGGRSGLTLGGIFGHIQLGFGNKC